MFRTMVTSDVVFMVIPLYTVFQLRLSNVNVAEGWEQAIFLQFKNKFSNEDNTIIPEEYDRLCRTSELSESQAL